MKDLVFLIIYFLIFTTTITNAVSVVFVFFVKPQNIKKMKQYFAFIIKKEKKSFNKLDTKKKKNKI